MALSSFNFDPLNCMPECYRRVKDWKFVAGMVNKLINLRPGVVAYLGHRVLGIPVVEIGRYFYIFGPAVSMYLEDGSNIAQKNNLNKLII
jgi:hypothetical protein